MNLTIIMTTLLVFHKRLKRLSNTLLILGVWGVVVDCEDRDAGLASTIYDPSLSW